MADPAGGARSRHGIDSAVLEASVASTGTVLEAGVPEAGRRRPDVWNATSGAGAVESRAAGAQERLRRRRTYGEAVGGAGADPELCARSRTASLADPDTPEVPADARSGAVAEP